jgi:CIC family chloride channel protein
VASYGTIYTTKLLRRGYDVDRAAPWRAFGDMTAADAMRPFPAPLSVAAGRDGRGGRARGSDGGAAAPHAPLPGTVTYRSDPHAVYAGESLTQTLRQLAAYGRDGLPVLSGDGGHAAGWITNDSVLHAIAREIGTAPPHAGAPAAQAAAAGPPDQATEPPTPLPGYQVLEIAIGPGSPGAGKTMGSIAWPHGYLPVSVLHGRSLHEPHPDLVLAPGDRISLLTGAAPGNGTDPAGTANHSPSPG